MHSGVEHGMCCFFVSSHIFQRTSVIWDFLFAHTFPIGTASANSVESDHGCTARIYFDNAYDNVMLRLYKVTLKSQNPC